MSYNPLEIRPFQQFYTYDNELYAIPFPREWAMNHIPKTGPKECKNCAYYGSWRGVFIGYCMNCAVHQYHFSRGNGFYACGLEIKKRSGGRRKNKLDGAREEEEKDTSAMNTYLKDADFNLIGDIELFPSHKTNALGKPWISDALRETADVVSHEIVQNTDPLEPLGSYGINILEAQYSKSVATDI